MWYKNYEYYKNEVENRRLEFKERCEQLHLNKNKIIGEFTREFVARAVHESNWHEGLELGHGKTQQFAGIAFDEVKNIAGPHLDMKSVLAFHRKSVARLIKDGSTTEEIGAYNLARAYHAVAWIGTDLATRHAVFIVKSLSDRHKSLLSEIKTDFFDSQIGSKPMTEIELGCSLIDELGLDRREISIPITDLFKTQGELSIHLSKLESNELRHPMRRNYIDFLHQLALEGIMPTRRLGVFRKKISARWK